MAGKAPGRLRALYATAVALATLGSALGPLAGTAGAVPTPMAIDFSGDGAVVDVGTFGVYGAAVEVTLWASTGLAAGPLTVAAGAGGAYAWALPQAPSGSLLNLTLRASLPWDPNVSFTRVFDVSNGTPQAAYPGVSMPLPFAATESLDLVLPSGALALPRGRQITAAFALYNDGNVSVAHPGFTVSLAGGNATSALVNASSAVVEEWPSASFGVNATFSAPPGATVEDVAGTLTVASTSGTNFTFPFTLRIVANRNAAVAGVTTAPAPPDEGRNTDIVVNLQNHGLDAALSVNVQVQATYASLPDVYLNSTAVPVAGGGIGSATFGWTPLWSPDPVTIVATATVADDWDASDDSDSVDVLVNSTNLPPSASFGSPVDGARVAGNITVSGSASDPENGPITLTVALDGGAPLFNASATSFGFIVDLSALPDGPHTITARAVDGRGLAGTSIVHITVLNRGPNSAPTVSITAPRGNDTVGASFELRGTAFDERSELASVLVSVDGGPEVAAAGTSSWSITLDGAAMGDGPHRLSVRAFDSIDYSAPAALDILVNATAPSEVLIAGAAIAPSPAEPGQAVTLTGNVTFDTLVLAAGANVSAQVRGFSQTSNILADARGHFALSLSAPTSAGTYTVDVVAVSGALQGNATVSLVVSTATLPDIELLPTGFALSPDPPPPNTPIHHTIEVLNNGVVTATATLRVWDGARGTGTLIYEWRFTITSSRQAAFDHAYAPGPHNLTIVVEEVDPQEADPSDNVLTVDVPVADAPDFTIESVTPSTRDITVGSNITFLVVVGNLAVTPGFVLVELWDGVPLAPNATKIHDERVGVAGQAQERVLFSWAPTAGEHNIVAQAVLASPSELILTNNQQNVTVSVPAPAAPPEPTFLPGFEGLAAVGAVAGAARARGASRPRLRHPNAAKAALALLLVAGLGAALLPAPTVADVGDASALPGPLNGVCAACHSDPAGGGPLNPFGTDYWAARNQSGGVNWSALGALDSDRDSMSNGDELEQSYLPGDPNSNSRTGIHYSRSGGGGVSGILTGLGAIATVSLIGVGLGFYMLKKRNARKAAKALAASEPAPKP